MKIAFGNDHAGLDQRDGLLGEIRRLGHEIVDFGTASADSVDYPDYAAAVAKAIQRGEAERGVLVCGTGVGMAIAANRFAGVRCANVTDAFAARMSRLHNDANCIALRAREQDLATNLNILAAWLETPFEGGRHQRRVDKIDSNGSAG